MIPAKPPKIDKQKEFLDAIGKLDPLQTTWMFNALAESAATSINKLREEVMRVERFGVDASMYRSTGEPGTTGMYGWHGPDSEAALKRIQDCKQWIAHHELEIKLCRLWNDARHEFEMPGVIASILARNPSRPVKPKPKR